MTMTLTGFLLMAFHFHSLCSVAILTLLESLVLLEHLILHQIKIHLQFSRSEEHAGMSIEQWTTLKSFHQLSHSRLCMKLRERIMQHIHTISACNPCPCSTLFLNELQTSNPISLYDIICFPKIKYTFKWYKW